MIQSTNRAGTSSDVRRPSLLFNNIHGENVRLTNNQRMASRTDSFCKALAFSDRAIGVDEIVCLRFSEVKTNWSGVLRFGITNTDPSTFGANLPKYACPDMTSKEGTWAKAMSDRYCQQGNIMHFFIRENGEMFYGINGILKGLFLSGINTRAPMFVVVDIYGNTTSVEFVDESEVPPLRRIQSKPRPIVPPPPTIPPPAIPVQAETVATPPESLSFVGPAPVATCSAPPATATCATPPASTPSEPPTTAFTATTSTAPLAAPEPSPSPRHRQAEAQQQQLARELERRMNFSQQQQRSMSVVAPMPQQQQQQNNTNPSPRRGSQDFAPLTYNKNLPITPLQFHATHGRTVNLNSDRTIATRVTDEYCGGYVFTNRPVRVMEKIILQILGIESAYGGGLAVGVTNCDPAQLDNSQFTGDADDFLNRPEFWAVNKDYERYPALSDEMAYFINEKGELVFQKNNEAPRILMHVDPSLAYYMLFDVYGRAQCIRCIGTTDARLRPTSPAPPTIPQHRRRQSHQPTNAQPQSNRRTVSSAAVPNPAAIIVSAPASTSTAGQSTPAAVQHVLSQYQQHVLSQPRSSGLTVNLPPPDIPRRVEVGRSAILQHHENSVTPIGQSTLTAAPTPRNNRHHDQPHDPRQNYQPPTRPGRPPPPAPPQRTHSVPTSQAMAAVGGFQQGAPNANNGPPPTMPRPASMSAVESQGNNAAAAVGGGSTDTPTPALPVQGRMSECSVCMDRMINCAVYPCGHMCMCYECGRTTWNRQGVCPICRQEIKDILRVFPAV